MAGELQGKRIAILATDGFEQVELTEPKKALEQAGATAQVVAPKEGTIKGWNHTDWGQEVPVDIPLASAQAAAFDALVLPGGVMNPDKLKDEPAGCPVRERFRGRQEADRCHMPRPMDAHRGGRGQGPHDDLVALLAHGPGERGRELG